jgi:hypothetical protein
MKTLPFMTGRIGSRRRRRVLVALMYGGAAAYAIAMTVLHVGVTGAALSRALLWICMAAIPLAAFGFFALWRSAPLHVVNGADRDLDERMIQRRNTSLAVSFRLMAVACAIEVVAWQMRLVFAYPARLDLASPFLWGDTIIAMTLPLAIMAWTEPNPRDD